MKEQKTPHHLNIATMQRCKRCSNIPMNTFATMNALTTQRCRCYAGIPMNKSVTMNVLTTQSRRRYINVPMNTSPIANVITMQHRRRYINIPMNVSATMNTLTSQLGTSCSFDSPGLARNEPTPGKHSQGDSTPQVLSFLYEGMLMMKPFMANYAQKAQHLRR